MVYSWYTNDSTTSASISNEYLWLSWVQEQTTTVTWGNWQYNNTSTHHSWRVEPKKIFIPVVITCKEIRRREKIALAKRKAHNLFLKCLSQKQRDDFERENCFYVEAKSGKRYLVDCKKRYHNVFEIDEADKKLIEYCIEQTQRTPLGDNHLAQKLLLEADEEMFKKIANRKVLIS